MNCRTCGKEIDAKRIEKVNQELEIGIGPEYCQVCADSERGRRIQREVLKAFKKNERRRITRRAQDEMMRDLGMLRGRDSMNRVIWE